MNDKKNIIYKVEPKDNEEINKRKPSIKIYINKKFLKLNDINIEIYLNGHIANFKRDKNKLKYTPKEKLHKGEYNIEVFIKFSKENIQQYKWKFYIKEKEKLNYYFGNLHSHTSYSSGQGTPLEAFNSARKMHMDFWAVTDHSKAMMKEEKWRGYKYARDKFNKKYKKILAVCGKEISVKGIGHLNLFNCLDIEKIRVNKLDTLENLVSENKDSILCINHPGKSVYNLKNKRHLNENICLMEVGNGKFPDKYNRYEKYYYEMLDKKWYLGAVNGQDNHKKDWGMWDNLTGIVASELKEEYIFSALKKRRTYSTESSTLKIKFKLGDNWMGSIIKGYGEGDNLKFTVKCEDEKIPIEKTQIVSNGGKVLQEKNFNGVKKVLWDPIVKVEGDNSWYLLKTIQSGGRVCISSPIFIV